MKSRADDPRLSRQPTPGCARSAAEVVRAVSLLRPDTRVRSAFVDFGAPGLQAALPKQAGLAYRAAVVVPVLLTAGYHARVRIPSEIATAVSTGLPPRVHLSAVLGPANDKQEDLVRSRLVAALPQATERAGPRPTVTADTPPTAGGNPRAPASRQRCSRPQAAPRLGH